MEYESIEVPLDNSWEKFSDDIWTNGFSGHVAKKARAGMLPWRIFYPSPYPSPRATALLSRNGKEFDNISREIWEGQGFAYKTATTAMQGSDDLVVHRRIALNGRGRLRPEYYANDWAADAFLSSAGMCTEQITKRAQKILFKKFTLRPSKALKLTCSFRCEEGTAGRVKEELAAELGHFHRDTLTLEIENDLAHDKVLVRLVERFPIHRCL